MRFVGRLMTFSSTNWLNFGWIKYGKSSSINSTHYAKLYPQYGDRIVTIDSVTLFHPIAYRMLQTFSPPAAAAKQPKAGLCFAAVSFLTISVRPTIWTSTGPIFTNFAWLVELRL